MSTGPRNSRRKRVRKFLAGLLFGTFLGLVSAEIGLRVSPGILSGGLADQVLSGYRASPGGIYYVVKDLPIRLCWPNYTDRLYASGYWWTHQTDARGFRNPPGVESDLLVLGDSQIYGHGVEEPETTCALLRRRFGRAAYNMARQGDCLHDSYILLRLFVDELRPRQVVLVVFYNDFRDSVTYKGRDMRAPELNWDYSSFRRLIDQPEARETRGSPLNRLLVFRLVVGLWLARDFQTAPHSGGISPVDPKPLKSEQILDAEDLNLAKSYYAEMLPHFAEACQRAGAKPYVVYLTWGMPTHSVFDAQAANFLSEVCSRQGIAFADTKGLITKEMLLPGDGHLAAQGHAALAQWLDALLADGQADVERKSPAGHP